MERWASIDKEDVHLASIRVYSNDLNPVSKKPRIVLFLPPNRDPADLDSPQHTQQPNRPVFLNTTVYPTSSSEPDAYELEMVNDSVDNQIVVAERPKDPSLSISMTAAAATPNTRARTTILTGRIKHECNLRPAFSESYRKQMRERHKKYNTPVRQIRMIDDAGIPGGRGGVNRLSSGVGVGATGAFGDLIVRCLSFLFSLARSKKLPSRRQSRNTQKASSSAWLACRAISYWINCFHCFEIRLDGAYARYENARSSLKSI